MAVRYSLRWLIIVFAVLAVATSACGKPHTTKANNEPDPTPTTPLTPAQQLASRAAFALDRSYTADYRFTTKDARFGHAEGEKPHTEATLRVSRTTDTLRVDIQHPGNTQHFPHTLTIVQNSQGTYRCVVLATASGCMLAAEPDEKMPDDPRIHHPFNDWLGHLASRHAAFSVETTQPSEQSPLSGVEGSCFSIEQVTASVAPPVDIGTYCFSDDGTITGFSLSVGTLTLTASGPPPASITLPAPESATLPATTIPVPPTPIVTPAP